MSEESKKFTIPYSFLMDILGREPHIGPHIAQDQLEEIDKIELGELNGYKHLEVWLRKRRK